MTQQVNKWLLLSSMQKAIRRGLSEEAVAAFSAAYQADHFHAMYRVAICALEDVGIANQKTVHPFLKTALRKKDLSEAGGFDFVKEVVAQLACGAKDRTACDAYWMASHLELPQSWRESAETAKEVFLNDNEALVRRTLAAWFLVGGKKVAHESMTEQEKKQHDIDILSALSQQLFVQQEAIEVAIDSSGYQKEGHFLAYPLVDLSFENERFEAVGRSRSGEVLTLELNSEVVDVGGIPILLAGVDGHTQEGKDVLRQLSRKDEVAQLLAGLSQESQLWHLKHALFRVEGQQVDKRLVYPTASKIFKQGKYFLDKDERAQVFCGELGQRMRQPEVLFTQLCQLVGEALPEIQEMRKQKLGLGLKQRPRL